MEIYKSTLPLSLVSVARGTRDFTRFNLPPPSLYIAPNRDLKVAIYTHVWREWHSCKHLSRLKQGPNLIHRILLIKCYTYLDNV